MRRAITWVFDVDGTLIDSLTGDSLRPGSADLLTHLRANGVRIVLWSAGGGTYAERRATQHGIAEFFDEFHDKDGRDASGRYRTNRFLATNEGAVFVDDRPEDMPEGADVIALSPYLAENRHDRGLAVAARRAGMLTAVS